MKATSTSRKEVEKSTISAKTRTQSRTMVLSARNGYARGMFCTNQPKVNNVLKASIRRRCHGFNGERTHEELVRYVSLYIGVARNTPETIIAHTSGNHDNRSVFTLKDG